MILEKHTALYSDLDVEYNQAMSGPYEDLSFRSDEVEVIAAQKDGKITGFWRPVVIFGEDSLQKLHIERLYDTCRNVFYQDYLTGDKLSVVSEFLMRQGYKATPYYTRVIDLAKPVEQLHSDIRKSYKSLVNKDERLIYSGSIKWIKKLHETVRGKRRNGETWDIQQKMIHCSEAFSVVTDAAAVLVYHNEHSAYYACGVSTGNSHAVLWHAILMAKELGCRSFEMGEQVFNGDKKEVNISKFKRGFGGKTAMRLNLEPVMKLL